MQSKMETVSDIACHLVMLLQCFKLLDVNKSWDYCLEVARTACKIHRKLYMKRQRQKSASQTRLQLNQHQYLQHMQGYYLPNKQPAALLIQQMQLFTSFCQ